MISKENLDKRICNCEKNSNNTQTYREFIIQTEDEFDMGHEPIDEYGDLDLQEYLEELDSLWDK